MSGPPGRRKFRLFRNPEAGLFILLIAVICYVLVQWHQAGREDEWDLPSRAESGTSSKARPSVKDVPPIPASGTAVKFLSYNIRNYFVEGERQRSTYEITPKNRESRQAVAGAISSVKPAFAGLCEVGGGLALKDLQERLKKLGIVFPYSFVLERPGEDRALAFLSIYPIVENGSQSDVPLHQKGKEMLRGILDVTVLLPDQRRFRFVGVHLKSKKDDDGSSENVRRMEAYALLDYLASTRSEVPLVVYGDFNDGPDSPVIQAVLGNKRDEYGLKRLTPRDSRRESWTLYYAKGQAYFSYDHLILNQAMGKRLGRHSQCGIVDSVDFLDASDHRPVWLELR